MNLENKIFTSTWSAINESIQSPAGKCFHNIFEPQVITNTWTSIGNAVLNYGFGSTWVSLLDSAKNNIDNKLNDYGINT